MAEENVGLSQEKMLKQLKASFDMYENTKKSTEKSMKEKLNKDGTKKYTQADIEKELELISEAEEDVIRQYIECGGKEEDLKKKKRTTAKQKVETETANIVDMMSKLEDERKKKVDNAISAVSTKLEQDYIPQKGSYNPEAAFDVIPLPSKGEGYKDKISKASVAYLTAYDENMIVSPNLYRDNLILDYILQEKLLSQEIDPMDLLEGDREAIILFLRASGYGNEYPISVTDEETGREFEAVIDLSKLKYKEFDLKGDANGWFEYKLPASGHVVKFRFPTHRDVVLLENMNKAEDPKLKMNTLRGYISTLDDFIETDKTVEQDERVNIRKAIRTLEKWADSMDEEEALKFNHVLTNRMNLLIMAVDGITDKNYISDFIMKMNVKDSSALRKYMQKNEPGIDYNITVQRPESLGGGSITTFLQLDQFLFLNLPE